MAHSLRDALKAKAMEVTHSESLELIAKTFGYENWNILSAKIDTAQPPAAPAAGPQGPAPLAVLYCSFCGKNQHDWFKEGFDTADLRTARALLCELHR